MAGVRRRIGGIDLGGTKILSVVLDDGLRVAGCDQRPTDAERGPAAVIASMVVSLRAAAAGERIAAAGVSAPGPCDPERGIVTTPPNLPGWHNVPVAALVSAALGVPVWLENDANAAALAEQRLGAGRGARNVVLVAIGTALGGGLVLDGRLYHGASGAAGEIGHIRVIEDGPVCGCGRRGCLEALVSGSALGRIAAAIAAREADGILAGLARASGQPPDALVLERAADAGDASAEAAIRQAGLYLGSGLATIVNVFNPEVIVIGGSIRKLGQRFLGPAHAVVREEAFPQNVGDVRIVEAELGDNAPAIGAAVIAAEKLQQA